MTLYILDEHGRTLTENSLKGIVREFFKITGTADVNTVSGNEAERELKKDAWQDDMKIIFIGGNAPFLLGSLQQSKLKDRVNQDPRPCREILLDIMVEDKFLAQARDMRK